MHCGSRCRPSPMKRDILVGGLKMLAGCPSRAQHCCFRSSRNPCFLSRVARVPVVFASLSSASFEEESPHLSEAALFPNNKERLCTNVEAGIRRNFLRDTSLHVRALDTIKKDIDKLEFVLMQSEEGRYGNDLSADAVWETQSKFNTLKEELCRLETLLELKEETLISSLLESTKTKTLLQDMQVQVVSLSLYKGVNEGRHAEELLRLENLSGESLDIFDKYLMANEAMNDVQEKVQDVWESIEYARFCSVSLKLIEILQSEASLSFESLLISRKELEREKSVSSNLLAKFQKSAENLKDRDLHINGLQHELANAIHRGDIVSKELSQSGAEISVLWEKLKSTEELLEKEGRALRTARDGLEKLEQALTNEESKVDDLFKEVSSLKAQLEKKEKLVLKLTDEAVRNKVSSETARKHLDAFHQSEKKAEQLAVQCSNLENQIRSRDTFLDEIRNEAFKSTEALKIATQIKQDLNHSKQRELELTQNLERERLHRKDLSRELMENSRAIRAELALRQAGKDIMDLNREISLLKEGIQSRDEVIKLMEEKIE